MTGWILLTIVLAVAAFFFGQARGRKQSQKQLPGTSAEQLREAWQQGYEAASEFLRRSGTQPQAPPSEQAPARKQAPTAGQPYSPQPWPGQPVATGSTSPTHPATDQTFGQQNPVNIPQPSHVVSRPATPPKPVKVLTKRERELRNINITLYVAALMIVAAGALFLSFALPPVAKLVAFFFLAAAFYAGGLTTYALKPSLRPAGAAFAGTGLALLPLCAIATYNTLAITGAATWLIFSAIGTLAVGYATLKLKSRVLSWVAVLILVSTGMAGAATLQRGILNYMLVLLLLSLVLLFLAVRSQRVRRSIFFQAVMGTAQLLPAFVIVLSAILFESLRSRDFFWIFALLTAQLLLSMRLLGNLRMARFYAARVTFMLMLVAGSNYVGFSATTTAMILAFSLALQALAVLMYSSAYQQRMGLEPRHLHFERSALWGLSVISVIGAYASSNDETSLVLSVLVVPVLALLALPGLLRGAKAEVAVVSALPLVALLDMQHHNWRPLLLFVVAIIGLSIARRRASGLLQQVCLHARWALLLVGAGVLGAAIHESLDGSTGRSEEAAKLVTVLAMALILWAIDLASRHLDEKGMPQNHLLGRIAASAAIAIASLCYLRVLAAEGMYPDELVEFIGLGGFTWFMITTVAATGLVMASGWRLRAVAAQRKELEQPIKSAAAALLLVLYAMSFAEGTWGFALLIGAAALADYLVNLRRSTSTQWKIIYASLAQLLFSSMVWWFARAMDFDLHGRFALLLVSLSIPQAARLLLSIRRGAPLRQELRWVAIGLLIGMPAATLGYGWLAGAFDRGVILLAALCIGIHGAMAFKADEAVPEIPRQFYLFAPIVSLIVVIGVQASTMPDHTGWIRWPWWSADVASAMLLFMSLLAVLAEWLWRGNKKYSVAIALAIFLPAALAAWWQAGTWWAVGAHALMAVALMLLVHSRRSAWYAIGGALMLTVAILRAVMEMRHIGGTRWLSSMDVSWSLIGTGVVLYLLAMAHGRMKDPAPGYPESGYRHAGPVGAASRIYFASMLLALLAAGCLAHVDSSQTWSIIGAAALIFGVAVVVRFFELPASAVPYAVDGLIVLGAVLVLTSYSRIIAVPQFSSIMAYFCVIAVVLVVWRNIKAHRLLEQAYLIAASVAGSMALFASLAESNTLAQVMGLVFFGCLIAWGLKLGERLFIWWGAIAITLSVIWFLRELVFLWLVIIGLGLIAAAVYKLVKVDKVDKAGQPSAEPPAYQAPAGQQAPPRLPWQQPVQPPALQQEQRPPASPQEPGERE